MIVCSCNVLSDHDVRDVVTASGSHSLTAHEVYGCLGCSMRCGRCAHAIKRILNETLAACASCCGGCPVRRPVTNVDRSVSVPIRGGDSAAANAQAKTNERNFRQADKQELLNTVSDRMRILCDPPVGFMPMPVVPRKPMPVVLCQERTLCSVIGADDTTAEPPDGSEIIRKFRSATQRSQPEHLCHVIHQLAKSAVQPL